MQYEIYSSDYHVFFKSRGVLPSVYLRRRRDFTNHVGTYVFANAKSRFSHDAAQIVFKVQILELNIRSN